MRAKAQLRISVVVPTCGRPALLWRCLDALSRQTLHPTDYEIVVVDDGHSAATRRTVQQIALGAIPGLTPRVRYVQPPAKSRGPAGARNSGWRAARADVVAFTDDDTVPAPDWLAEGLRVMSSKVSAASGYIHVPLPFDPTDWDLNTAGLDGAEFATANCFVRRGALEAIGGFDERFLCTPSDPRRGA
jgi:GT2 family glycosyltransferase